MFNRIKYTHVFPLILILIVFIVPLLKNGLIVGGDWTFPSSNSQLKNFANEGLSLWSIREIPTGSQLLHQNIYLFQRLAGVWAGIGFDGKSFQKTTLFLTILGIYFFSYLLFFKLTKNKLASVIGALTYLFSPPVFNYINMGWNFVLFYLALAPLFCMVAIDFFSTGGFFQLIGLGYIAAIGLFQSQSIVWFLLLYFFIFLYKFRSNNSKTCFLRFLLGVLAIILFTSLIHLPWILPIILKLGYSFNSTTGYDLARFSVVSSLLDSFRNWGSLYNLQFELSYPSSLLLFSFFPLILVIYSIITSKSKKNSSLYNLAIGLFLIAPIIYYYREFISRLPFSSVIRDGSRFLVMTSLGLSLGVTIAISEIKNKKILIGIIVSLILSVYPFVSGKLYITKNNPISSANTYKDFRLRLLDLPDNSGILKKYSNQRNLFMPTGGFVFTKTDDRFNRSYWGIADIEARFSEFGSGIYFNDKSNPLVTNFTNNIIESQKSWQYLNKLARIYGIDNLFYREGLVSTLTYSYDEPTKSSNCKFTDNLTSDWSISFICSLTNSYPLFFTSVETQYSTASLSGVLTKEYTPDKYLTLTGCPDYLNLDPSVCPKILDKLGSHAPTVTIQKKGATNYLVRVTNISGNFILVFNNTYHPGWILSEQGGINSKLTHILINQLTNGWLVNTKENVKSLDFSLDFYPQIVYSRAMNWSLSLFVITTTYLIYHWLFIKKDD